MPHATELRPYGNGLVCEIRGRNGEWTIQRGSYDDEGNWTYQLHSWSGTIISGVPHRDIVVSTSTYKDYVGGGIELDDDRETEQLGEGDDMGDGGDGLSAHGRLLYERIGQFLEDAIGDPDSEFLPHELSDIDGMHKMCERRLGGGGVVEEEQGETNFVSA
jgi:hypothetical protein